MSVNPSPFITFFLGKQMFAMPLAFVRDAIKTSAPIIPVPHAPAMVKGALAVRDHVAIAIDLRARLGLPAGPPTERAMLLVVEYGDEWFALLVDRIDDVAYYRLETQEGMEVADPLWNHVIAGIITKAEQRIVVLDIAGILEKTSA